MRTIYYTICLGLFCISLSNCLTSYSRSADNSNHVLSKESQLKIAPQEKPASAHPGETNTTDTPVISKPEVKSVKIPRPATRPLMVSLDSLGQFDAINLRPAENEEVIVSLGRFIYHPRSTQGTSYYTSEALDTGKYLSTKEGDIYISEIPSKEMNPVLFDLAIPPTAQVTLSISGEVRFEGKVKQAVAWRGFLKLDGAADLSTSTKLIATQSKRKIWTKYPHSEYPPINVRSRNFNLSYTPSLPIVFRGTEVFMMQVDKEMRIVSAAIIDLDPAASINQRLLEAIKGWKVSIDGDLTPFTVGIHIKPGMIKEK